MPYFELSLIGAVAILGVLYLFMSWRLTRAEANIFRLLLATAYLLEDYEDEDDPDTD